MGEVMSAVTKRTSGRIKTPLSGGLLETSEQLRDELSRCIRIKDQDALCEGPEHATENIRKAAMLRAAHALVTHVCGLLEDYATNVEPEPVVDDSVVDVDEADCDDDTSDDELDDDDGVPMMAVGNDQLTEPLGDTHTCKVCGAEHEVLGADDILQFVKCGDKTFVIGIRGRRIDHAVVF